MRSKKPFYRYEDVPLLLAAEDQDPVMVFANNASISASQPLEAKKFIEDYNISFAIESEDIHFQTAHESGFLLGPTEGPANKVPQSIEVVRLSLIHI